MVIFSLLLAASGCHGDEAPEPDGTGHTPAETVSRPAGSRNDTFYRSENASFQILDDGLTASEREEFFHLTTGGELFPLRWMQSLINPATGALFLENPGRFGLIPAPSNPEGLPIGLTVADSSDFRSREKMVGINCAACHTGNLTYSGDRIVIVGSSSLFDAERFLRELYLAAGKTAETPDMLVNFMHRLRQSEQGSDRSRQPDGGDILSHLVQNSAARSGLTEALRSLAANAADAEADERLQSFSPGATRTPEQIRSGLLHGFEEDVRHTVETALKAVAAVPADQANLGIRQLAEEFFMTARLLSGRIAFAGDLAELWKHHPPSTPGGPGRMDKFEVSRRLLFSATSEQRTSGPCSTPPLFGLQAVRWTGWDGQTTSTANRNLLTALSWGSISDPQTHHSTVPLKNLARIEELAGKLKSPAWPVDVFGELDAGLVQTGESVFRKHCAQCHRPEMVDAKNVPRGSVYPLSEIGTDPMRLDSYLRPLNGNSYSQILERASQAYLDAAIQAADLPAADSALISEASPNRWQDSSGYVARRLEGIWATSPYLHNGSVPTLKHLLLPATFRPSRFSTHRTEYDTNSVGLIYDVTQSHEFIFDTTQPGNSNSGHEYGVGLNQTSKKALLEYLKSL